MKSETLPLAASSCLTKNDVMKMRLDPAEMPKAEVLDVFGEDTTMAVQVTSNQDEGVVDEDVDENQSADDATTDGDDESETSETEERVLNPSKNIRVSFSSSFEGALYLTITEIGLLFGSPT